ncbi:MAG: NigD-like N-terminal domain-containing protein [Bacteroidaceae bacterium]|nr:NigD-like N-terminal domain-containing protein [Bacteroidaceae bacterium]
MNRNRILFFWEIVSLLPLAAGLTSCSNDDDNYTYPNLLNEFADVATGPSARFTHLLTDKGERLPVVNAGEIATEGVTPDTVYRTMVGYVPVLTEEGTSGAQIYTLQAIAAPQPQPSSEFAEVKADPLEMQSIWRGGNYLNLILLVKAQKGRHTFHFIEDSVTVSASTGHRTLYLRLYHDANDDVQAYTQKVGLSLPLSGYSGTLAEGDSIEIRIPTPQGWEPWVRGY